MAYGNSTPFGIGLLPVWGSAPQDTRVYVDGVSIPLLYHFGGLRSTFNSEMVQQLTFVPGAYQADHGLGLGGLRLREDQGPAIALAAKAETFAPEMRADLFLVPRLSTHEDAESGA